MRTVGWKFCSVATGNPRGRILRDDGRFDDLRAEEVAGGAINAAARNTSGPRHWRHADGDELAGDEPAPLGEVIAAYGDDDGLPCGPMVV